MKKIKFLLPLVLATTILHLGNTKIFSTAKTKLHRRELNTKIYNWKFGTIRYQHQGIGSPVLLIHDTFSGSSSIEFDRLIQNLSKNHSVYTLDLLGYGFSEKPHLTYTAYLYVQLIHDFIHEIIQESNVDIITSGNSNVFALFAAHQEPSMIHRIIMINPSDLRVTSMNPTKRDFTIKYLIELPFIGTSIYNLLHNKGNYKKQFKIANGSNSLSYFIDQFHTNAHFMNSSVRYSFASYLSNYMNLSVEDALKTIDHSIYIIHGENRTTNKDYIENQYMELNPAIETATIKNTADFPHLENPFSTCDLIRLFLHEA